MKPSSYVKKLKKAIDRSVSEHLQKTHAALVDASPVDTGRLASSWNMGHNTMDLSTKPKDWKGGPVLNKYSQKITAEGSWYISNNLDYASITALDPTRGVYGKGGRVGASMWFSNIATQQKYQFNTILQNNLNLIR